MRIQQQPRSGYTGVRVSRRRLVGLWLGLSWDHFFCAFAPPAVEEISAAEGGGCCLSLSFSQVAIRPPLCPPTKLEQYRRMRQVGTPVGEVRAPRAPRARHHLHAAKGIDQQRFEAGDDQVGDYGRRTPVHQQQSQGRRQNDDRVASCQPLGCFF